jgi:hypothetical protein
MALRLTLTARYGLAAAIALAISAGCGGKPTVNDTAEVNLPPSKAPAEPAKTETPTPAPEPAKDAPKG